MRNGIYNRKYMWDFSNAKNPVEKWVYGPYWLLVKYARVNDKLDHDHIPSAAAVVEYLQKRDHILLAKTEPTYDNVYNNATALEVPHEIHAAGRTYKGKNRVLWREDAKDLRLATIKDLAFHFSNSFSLSLDQKLTFARVYTRNKILCLYE